MSYEALVSTGLTYRELASLVGLNHMTVYYAMKGEAHLRDKNRAKMDSVMGVLLKLVETGKLPMKATERVVRDRNVEKIKAYVERVLAA